MDRYTAERRPFWGELTIKDHESMVHAGGQKRLRSKGEKTIPGVLAELLPLRPIDPTAPALEAWTANESKTREIAGKAETRNDYLQREQLPAWFEHVRQLPSPVISAYLQCLLLTGARREELAALRCEAVNFQWRGMDLKDKIEGNRPVPLTPYVQSLIERRPKANEWVFSSARFVAPFNGKPDKWVNTSASGRLIDPSNAHRRACAGAGLDGLTLHGLRRSFASLCEWLDIPGGISAQIQGHAPHGYARTELHPPPVGPATSSP